MTENARLIESLYQAFSRGDIPFILERIADDCDWNGPDTPELPHHGNYRGKEAALFFQRIADHLQPTAFEPEVYVTEGNNVMTTGWWACTVKSNGVNFRAPWAMRFVVENGLVTYTKTYEDTAIAASALRAK